jgi:hypothetical protein
MFGRNKPKSIGHRFAAKLVVIEARAKERWHADRKSLAKRWRHDADVIRIKAVAAERQAAPLHKGWAVAWSKARRVAIR